METLLLVWGILQICLGLLFFIFTCMTIIDDSDNISTIFIMGTFSIYCYIFIGLENINKIGKIILCILWSLFFIGFQLLLILAGLIIILIYLLVKLFCKIFKNKGE